MRRLLLVLILLLGAVTAHLSHRAADRQRHEVDADTEILFLPSGTAMRVASMGYHEFAADWLWIRTVLLFGERWGQGSSGNWGPWMAGMVVAITELDPGWRTPYFYGGVMLRLLEDVDSSDIVFKAGAEAFPDDPFFPFAVGMNAYLLRHDTAAAARWVRIAADRPGAPIWYKAAAAGFLVEENQRATAIRFLQEELDVTADPDVREVLQEKLAPLQHDDIVGHLAAIRQRYVQAKGHDISTPQDLETDRFKLPPDPMGGQWILALDGEIRSDIIDARMAEKARKQERSWLERRRWSTAP